MKSSEIEQYIREKAGIANLNEMQQAMMTCDTPRVVLLAPTGSGKTLAFTIYLLRHIARPSGHIQAVVMAPSRELVLQIYSVVREVAVGLKVTPLYGGHAMTDEVNSLSVSPDIVVATPGRLLDHINRHHIDLGTVSTLVIDEYDKSLELGFADEMTRIARRLKSVRYTVLTSATPIAQLPEFIHTDGKIQTLDFTSRTTSPRHRMQVVRVESPVPDKLDTLIELLRSITNQRVIVFVNHRESAERVHDALVKASFPAGLYHGALEQRERQLAVDLFDNGTTPVLVATDLASRGLDINNVGSVIHYHLPVNAEAWTHRNGRTARQDASGTIYVITTERENTPEFITYDRDYVPTGRCSDPIHSDIATLYINAGKREKISRGDIAGYMIKCGGLEATEVGQIKVADHYSIVAVPRTKARAVADTLAPLKLKNTRVKVSVLR